MQNRPVIIFLMINFIIGILILVNFRTNQFQKIAGNNTVITEAAEQSIPIKPQPVVATAVTSKAPTVTASVPQIIQAPVNTINTNPAPVKPSTDPAVCMIYGPLDIEQKATLDTLFRKEKLAQQPDVEKKNQFEIYWNLGTNEVLAQQMFQKQKKDALQDNKFKLTQSEGVWIVSIAIINDNIETAKALALQLSAKANKVKAGGRWQYRTLPDAYFYKIKNINAINPSSLAQITTGMGISKKPCLS